jgi:light-regulated signal transduction histidine kinase (bacteriophytochrome)
MVASYTKLLARRYQNHLDTDAHQYIAFAVEGAVRMQQLLTDLLTYSRVGSGALELRSIATEKVLEDVLINLKVAIEEAGATITHDPLPLVMADDVQLMQLLQNLIANAIKFRGSAKPQIHVGAESRETEWIFTVRDNGIGIEPAYFERIFVIFQRLHTRDEYPGTGLGLALCKKIVERHRGRIWVESTVGKGSIFFFTLPKANELR